MYRKALLIAAELLAAAGCNRLRPIPEARKGAYDRWHATRAQMLTGVAAEHLSVGQLDDARNKAMQALALDGDQLEARILLGKVLIEQGHYDLAAEELTKVRRRRPEYAEVYYLLGVAQERSGQYEEALASYNRAHALEPKNLDAVAAATETLVALGRVREAQLHVESYLARAEQRPVLYELAGRLAMMQGEHERAARYYRHACDLDFENTHYREALANAQYFAGQYEPAVETLRELLATKGYEGPAWAYAMLGDSYLALGRPHPARDAYWKATDRKPDAAGLHLKLAKAALALQDNPRAVLAAQKALGLDADNSDAYMILGYAMLRQGRTRQALGLLKTATSRYPESSMLHCLLGRAYAADGEDAEARRCYAEAVRLDPDNEAAKELLRGAAVAKLSRSG